MRKKFALNLAILIGANLLVKPFWIFGIDRVVQNTLGAASYGLFFAVFNYSLLFSVLLDVGLNNFNNRAVSRVQGRLPEYFGNLLLLKVLLAVVYFSLTFIAAWWNGFNAEKLQLLSLLLCNQILLTLILFFRSNLQALQLFKADSIISITDRLLSIFFCGSIIWWGVTELSIVSFILAQSAALLITCAIAGGIVATRAGWNFKIWSAKFRFKILKSTFPYALLVLLMTIYARIDAVLLESLLGTNGALQAGIYAASFRIFDAANQFGFLFSTILLPMFAANFKQQKSNEDLVGFGLQGITVFAVGVSVLCVVWAPYLLQILYHQAGREWQQVFVLTMLAFIPASYIYIMGTLLTAKGEIFTLCKISLAAVAFNFTANYIFIPQLGAVGSAATALATNILVCVLHFVAVVSRTDIRFSLKFLGSLLAFTAVSFATCYAFSQVVAASVLALVVSMGIIAILALLLQVVPIHELQKIIAGLNARIVKRSNGA